MGALAPTVKDLSVLPRKEGFPVTNKELLARIKRLEAALREIEKQSHKGAVKTSTKLPGCSGCIAKKVLEPQPVEDIEGIAV